jgi:RNA polymerase sigma-70 factor (ECF subfamily)
VFVKTPKPLRPIERLVCVSLAPMADPDDGRDVARIVPLPILTPSFETFFRANHVRVVALAAAMVGRAAADDLAQEAFVRAHCDWATVSSYDRPDAWVRRVVVNLAISAGRSRRSEARAVERLAARHLATVAEPGLPRDQALWVAVRALPPRQRAAVALRYVDDLSVAEIAAALGCAEGTAKALLHQGRTTLADRLGEARTRGDDA